MTRLGWINAHRVELGDGATPSPGNDLCDGKTFFSPLGIVMHVSGTSDLAENSFLPKFSLWTTAHGRSNDEMCERANERCEMPRSMISEN